MNQKEIAEKNIKLYVFVKIFAKRVYLPLTAIYFVTFAGLSIQEIGLLTGFYALVSFVLDVPTGIFSDLYGRRHSIRIAGVLIAIATLIYVFIQTKTGVFVGVFFEAAGYTFLAGAAEALLHDSLVYLKKEKQYTRVASRAQAKSLLVNTVVIAIIPMTYAIDARVPFLIGTLAYIGMIITGFKINDVYKSPRKRTALRQEKTSKLALFKKYKNLVPFVFMFGLIGAAYIAPKNLIDLSLIEFGLKPELLGWLFAAGSLSGAIFGFYAHSLKRLSVAKYAFIDGTMLLLWFMSFYSGDLLLPSLVFIINMTFWRYRRIIYQDYILEKYTTKMKATLLSTVNNLETIHIIWLPVVMAFSVAEYGVQTGFMYIGFVTAGLLLPFVLLTRRALG